MVSGEMLGFVYSAQPTGLAIGISFVIGNPYLAGFISGVISGGDLKSGIIGALTAGAFQAIGPVSGLTDVGRIFAKGVVGGIGSVAQGGKFGSGFLSGSFGAAAGTRVNSYLAAAVAGGIGSVLGGGKFANGAVTGAFAYAAGDAIARAQAEAAPPPLISGGGNMATIQAELAKLPPDVLEALRSAGIKIVGVNNSITEHLTRLNGVSPRGWPPGATFNSVPGVFDQASLTVVIATSGLNPNGSFNLVLHEVGHAYDFARGNLSGSASFMTARSLDSSGLSSYYKQAGYAGLSETFAESFANFYGANSNYSTSHPNLNAYWLGKP